MRKLITLAAPKKGGALDALYWLKTLLKSKWSASRSGGPIIIENGLVRLYSGGISSYYIESSDPDIEALIREYKPLADRGSIEEGSADYKKLVRFARTLDNLVAKSKAKKSNKANSSNEDIILKGKMLPANFTGLYKGTPCLFVIDGTKKGLDEKAMVMASEGRALIGKNIPLDKIEEVALINPKTQWDIFHDTVMFMARDIK